ncbi:hypothetical protein LINPERPRIM_LOCUS24987, partial [Linum perenne]
EALSTHLKLLKLTPFSELSFHSPKSSNLSFTGITIFLLQIWRRTDLAQLTFQLVQFGPEVTKAR